MKRHRSIILIFLAALIVRFFMIFLTHYWLSPELKSKIIPPDARGYKNAINIKDAWKNNESLDDLPWGKFPNYDFYKAGIIYIAGYHYAAVPLVNSFLGALMVFFIYGTARRFFGEKPAQISALLCAFFPSLIFWSSQNLKDMPSLFVVVAAAWAVLKFHEPFRFFHLGILALIIPLLLGLNELRCYIFIFFMYAAVGSFLLNITKENFKKNIVYAVLFFMLMSAFPKYTNAGILTELPLAAHRFLRYRVFMLGSGNVFDRSMLDISGLLSKATRRHNRAGAVGNASIRPNQDFSSTLKIIQYLPTGVAYFLFAPFPWEAEGLLQVAAMYENIFWCILCIFALYGLYIYKTKWKLFFTILFFTGLTVLAYSLYEGNFGTGYRHKAVLLPFFFIFASAGILHFVERIKNRKP